MLKRFRSVLALDIGGTKIAAGLVSRGGTVSRYQSLATPHGSTADLIRILGNLISAYPKRPVAIGIAGQVQTDGRVHLSSHIHKKRPVIALSNVLTRATHRPVVIANDAQCFSVAEMHFGFGKKYQTFIGITWGTGIGGGIIIQKKLYRGTTLSAGEIGHLTIPEGKRFVEWEHTCGGPVLATEYARLSGVRATNEEIVRRWRNGEAAARIAITTIAQRFGAGLASLANVINPEALIIGGGMSEINGLLPIARKTFQQNTLNAAVARTPIIVSKLKKDAVLLGAAALQRHHF